MSAEAPAGGGATYFTAYEDVNVHRLMLSDRPRNEAYARALAGAELAGKVVLDVGCGTGYLSMLAAKCGARKVYAIEASGMAEVAHEIVRANGLEVRRAGSAGAGAFRVTRGPAACGAGAACAHRGR